MSGYVLQPTASGHVINWTALPGVVVGYPNFPGALVSLASLSRSGGQQFLPSFPSSGAERPFPLPDSASPSYQDPMRGQQSLSFPRLQQGEALEKSHYKASGAIRMKSRWMSTDENVKTAAETGERMLRCRSVNYCRICRVTFNAPSQAQQHYAGRHHARKAKLCSQSVIRNDDAHHSSSASSASLSSSSSSSSSSPHMTSSTAASDDVMTESTGLQDEIDDSVRRPKHSTMVTCETGSGSAISANVYCRLCSVAFNSDKQALQHYAGKIHAKRLRAENVIYAYNRHGRRNPRAQRTLQPAAAADPTTDRRALQDDAFVCIICGLLLKSQRLLDRHQRRHRHIFNRVFSGLRFDSRFPLSAGL